jgi:hypothetical protein
MKIIPAVVTVGQGGRGFIVAGPRHSKLTAAHCLPHFPPAHPASYVEERTYASLLGPLGETPTVWAECLFADPIADIAVLGEPDDQTLCDEATAYEAFVESLTPIAIADTQKAGRAWVLSLDLEWFECGYQVNDDGPLFLLKGAQPVQSGMSGSPIVLRNGKAIGAVSLGANALGTRNPRMVRDLPGWLLRVAGFRKVP